jgi:phage tail protein X
MLTYITKDGDRWDLIAYKFYGDPYLYPVLLSANPELCTLFILPGGKKVNIPVLYVEEEEEVNPPWQRD